jgi:tryptophanyl-tRNA synthetase
VVRTTSGSLESSVKAITQATEENKDISESFSIRNPLKVKTKGRPKGSKKRYRSMAEQIRQGKRSCGKCKQHGHDKRNCPN